MTFEEHMKMQKDPATMSKAEKIDDIMATLMRISGESEEFIQEMLAKWKAERGADA